MSFATCRTNKEDGIRPPVLHYELLESFVEAKTNLFLCVGANAFCLHDAIQLVLFNPSI